MGEPVAVRTLPRPVQPELPVWVTAAGNPETYRLAGELGANVLTHLLGQTVEELAEKLALYRQAWREAGHPGEGHVALMLHTFVGDDEDAVRETVREPMKEYLRSSVDLISAAAWSFPTFENRAECERAVAGGAASTRPRWTRRRWTPCSTTPSSATSRPAASSARRSPAWSWSSA